MTMLSTTNYGIKYPDKNEPPQISTHLANIAIGIDTAMKSYQDKINADFTKHQADEKKARDDWTAASTTLWNNWKGPYDTQLANIQTQLAAQGWGVPVTIAGTLFTAATGYTVNTGGRGVKVGNMVAWTYKFQKAADPAITAGASGNLANPGVLIGTLTAAMPTPTTYTPFSTMEDGYQVMGYLTPTKQIYISALAPNVNFPKLYPATVGGIYMFNPLVP